MVSALREDEEQPEAVNLDNSATILRELEGNLDGKLIDLRGRCTPSMKDEFAIFFPSFVFLFVGFFYF